MARSLPQAHVPSAPRAPSLLVNMTPAQQHAQDETVRVLSFYADAAERWLKKIDTTEGLCPCALPLSKCRCPVRGRP